MIDRSLSHQFESSRQGFLFGSILIGYGAVRTAWAVPDPTLTAVNVGDGLVAWIRLGVGLVGLLAGAWLLRIHRDGQRRGAATMDARPRMLRGIP